VRVFAESLKEDCDALTCSRNPCVCERIRCMMMAMKTVLSIRVSKDTRIRLDREARRLGTSASELARRAVDRFLADSSAPDTRTLYDRVSDCIGVWDSGIPDLATNSKHHLREKFRKIREARHRT
jgi:hypothetical protein